MSIVRKSKKKRVDLVLEQIKLQNEIYGAGYNIVTCGDCGAILLHRLSTKIFTIDCFSCLRKMSLSDCPDYWYEGAELSGEFED